MSKKRGSNTKKVVMILCRVAAVCVLSVLLMWSVVAGMTLGFMFAAAPIAVLSAGLALALFWDGFKSLVSRVREKRIGRILSNICFAGFFAAAIGFLAISGLIATAEFVRPAPENATLIIHGCRPSIMLRNRVRAGIAYLEANPDSVAIATGGQGPGDWIAEAEWIKNYLVNSGISEDRIFIENRSTSTYENIMFSKEIIERYGLSTTVALVSDGFHLYRAAYFAESAGLTAGVVPADTSLFVLPFYWIREVFAILAAWLLI